AALVLRQRDDLAGARRFGHGLGPFSALYSVVSRGGRVPPVIGTQGKDDKLNHARFVEYMAILGPQVESLLQSVVAKNIPRMSGSCANLLEHRAALWTFVDHDGVEPTNNHAERELRGFVLWRRRSFGTQSERGNRFAERMMTVAHTARKQGKNVFAFIRACCEAKSAGNTPPALLEKK
ncbi:MAG: transposase, partial [Planctomycetota bacterium]